MPAVIQLIGKLISSRFENRPMLNTGDRLIVPRRFDTLYSNIETPNIFNDVPGDVGDTDGDGLVNIDYLNNVRNNFGANTMIKSCFSLDKMEFPF